MALNFHSPFVCLPRDYRCAQPYLISVSFPRYKAGSHNNPFLVPLPNSTGSKKLGVGRGLIGWCNCPASQSPSYDVSGYSGMGPHYSALRGRLTLHVGPLPCESQLHHALVSDASLGRQKQGRLGKLCHLKQKSGHGLISTGSSFFLYFKSQDMRCPIRRVTACD